MADLKVSSAAVNDAATQLAIIKDDLENSDKNREAWENYFGHPIVNDAVNQFINDWWVKREKLLENIEELHAKMEEAAEAWDAAEKDLSDVFTAEES